MTRNADGVGERTAAALLALETSGVQRSTIWALLPAQDKAHAVARRKRNSKPFRTALQDFERRGWIVVVNDLVWVTDRPALRTFADRAGESLDYVAAVEQVREELTGPASAEVREIRRVELIALERLLSTGPDGRSGGGRGAVRVLPRSSTM